MFRLLSNSYNYRNITDESWFIPSKSKGHLNVNIHINMSLMSVVVAVNK